MRREWEEAQFTHRAQSFYLPRPFHSHNQLRNPDTALQLVARVAFTQALTVQTLTAFADFAPIATLTVPLPWP